MGKEIERKFLVTNRKYREISNSELILQGFLSIDKKRVVRIRIKEGEAFLTIKGKGKGLVRQEYEYPIPVQDAQEMLDEICLKPYIKKSRYKVYIGSVLWEIDEFLGVNEGLVIAEVELDNENQQIELPDWIGEEVTEDEKYYNVNLIKKPYKSWKK